MNRYLYCSLATTKKYVEGIVYLYNSFLRTKSKYPFLALITSNIDSNDIDILKEYKIPFKIIPYYSFLKNKDKNYFKDTINKFQIFDLKDYDKVFFLDADMFLFKNLDDMLDSIDDNEDKIYCFKSNGNDLPIGGEGFIISPNKYSFKDILNKYQETNCTDEGVLCELYKNNDIIILKNYNNLGNILYHDGGYYIKYWECLNINIELFFQLDSRALQSFFFIYWNQLKHLYFLDNQPKKYLYVSLATNSKYLKGAYYLYKSLIKTKSKYPFLLLVTDNLLTQDYEYLDSKKIPYKIIKHKAFKQENRFKDTINKFEVLNLKEYDKVFFIDSDILLIKNIDFLFDLSMDTNILITERYKYPNTDNEDYDLGGEFFIIKPKNIDYDNIIEKDAENIYGNDEEILLKYFKNDHDVFPRSLDIKDYIYHDGTPTKYWELFNFNIDTFFKLEEPDFQCFKFFMNNYHFFENNYSND